MTTGIGSESADGDTHRFGPERLTAIAHRRLRGELANDPTQLALRTVFREGQKFEVVPEAMDAAARTPAHRASPIQPRLGS
jgi:hypothetical protein